MSWAPPPVLGHGGMFDGKVDLDDVERTIAAAHERFGFHKVYFDPAQAIHMAQRLASRGVPMEPLHGTIANHTAMATCTLNLFSSGAADLYFDEGLVRDLQKLQFIDRGPSWRLESIRTKAGHGDKAWSFIYAAYAASTCPVIAWDGSLGFPQSQSEGRSIL